MRSLYLTTAFLLLFTRLAAQTGTTPDFPELKLGEWQQHLPWQRAVYVSGSDTKVYYATEWAVVEIDKADRSPRFLTKVEGLSDVGMNLVRFNKAADALLIAYSNSNLDIYRPASDAIINLPFIKTNLNIIGDKKIYNVAFQDKAAFLACGFGIIKMNLERAEVEYTVFTGTPVRSCALYNGYIYAGTEEGVYRIAETDQNPEDFSRWQQMGVAEGFPVGSTVNALCVAFNRLYMGIEKTLYSYDGQNVNTVRNDEYQSVIYLTSEGAGLVIGWKLNFDGRVSYLNENGAYTDIHWTCEAGKPFYAVEDGTKTFWFADNNDQFRYFDMNAGTCERFEYNSPYNAIATEIAIARDKVFVTTPGVKTDQSPLYSTEGMYIYEEGQWRRFNGVSNPELTTTDCHRDLWRVAPDENNNRFFAGSNVGGLVEATDDGASTQCFTKQNSILQSAGITCSGCTSIGGIAFDADGNLWIANYDAVAPIAVLKTDGTLKNFTGSPLRGVFKQVAVDQNGYKWFVVNFNGGLLVYDSGDDIDSPADDRYRVLTTANSVLPTNTVNCVAVDLEGDVWVGTQQGVVSFECGSNVFDSNCKGSRRIVNVDGFNGYLLETEDVRSIAIDGANRKWFGTTNGIFVQSSSGEEQIARYNTTNSPLFDNNITDMAINAKTGEVWIGTEKGLISLRGEAVEGGRINTRAPYAYPNPVRADYDGPIAIYGLARDANVKITDIAGNLVYEGKALGGQAVWDGRDYLGRRVASGVYMIFATSSESFENPDAIITKVVILN